MARYGITWGPHGRGDLGETSSTEGPTPRQALPQLGDMSVSSRLSRRFLLRSPQCSGLSPSCIPATRSSMSCGFQTCALGFGAVCLPLNSTGTIFDTPLRAPECVLGRSEEHTSELQSRENLVCRLLLEKKK